MQVDRTCIDAGKLTKAVGLTLHGCVHGHASALVGCAVVAHTLLVAVAEGRSALLAADARRHDAADTAVERQEILGSAQLWLLSS